MAPTGTLPYASPSVRKFARELGVPLDEVKGSGSKGRITADDVQNFTKQVLDHMRERLSDYQEMYGDLYNLEATPAESTSYRLAKHDVEL